jgi:hypothetical protein
MAKNSADTLTWPDVRKRLWLAAQQLFLHDRYLLKHGVMECAISHRLAVYLEIGFPGWDVDCEFNKDGDDPKLADVCGWRPDVIVHRRGKDGPNLLSVEVKKGNAELYNFRCVFRQTLGKLRLSTNDECRGTTKRRSCPSHMRRSPIC